MSLGVPLRIGAAASARAVGPEASIHRMPALIAQSGRVDR